MNDYIKKESVISTPSVATAYLLSLTGNIDLNNTDSSVNIQQMNHLGENNGRSFALAQNMVEDSDKWG